jgi:hypothetical protein
MAQIILDSNNNLIQGDFDNATLNNRTKLQTTTTNATTNVYVVPNGSSTSAGVSVANNSSLTNASKIVMATNGSTDTQIISGVNGSGSYLPMSFYTNNTLAMQITTAGNIVVAATAAPAFSAYQSSSQTGIVNGVFTKILFQTEEWDTNNNFASSTFTPTVAGYYQVNAGVAWSAGYSSAILSIYKNGSAYKDGTSLPTSTYRSTVNAIVYCNGSTDYVEIYGQQTSGGSGSIAIAINYTYFQAAMIRSA